MEIYTLQDRTKRKTIESTDGSVQKQKRSMEAAGKAVRRRMRVSNPLLREMMAEFMGTGFLVMIGTGSVAQWLMSRQERNAWIGINLCWGLAVAFSAYCVGGVTGGHLNPAISVMQWVLGNVSCARMLLYSVAQTAGAFVGALITFITYYDAINDYDGGIRSVHGENATAGIFTTFSPSYLSVFGGVFDQIVGTAILGCCVAAISDKRNNIPGFLHPLFAGLVVAMIGMCFGLNCGYPINPGRDLGPRILTLLLGYGWEVFSYNDYCWFWVPLVGPTIGAVVGAWVYKLFVGLHWPIDPIGEFDPIAKSPHAEEMKLIAEKAS